MCCSGKRTTLQKGEKTRKFLLKQSPLRAEASLTSLCPQPSPINIFYVNEYMKPTCTWREKKYYTPSWRNSGDMKEHDWTDMFSYKKCNGIEGNWKNLFTEVHELKHYLLAHRKPQRSSTVQRQPTYGPVLLTRFHEGDGWVLGILDP